MPHLISSKTVGLLREGETLRSADRPEGFGHPDVAAANGLAERSAALAEVALGQGSYFSTENPYDSPLWELKALKRLRVRGGGRPELLNQGAYGSPILQAHWSVH